MSSLQVRAGSRPQTTRTKTTEVAATSLVGRGVRRLARTAVLAGGVALAWGSVERRFPTVRYYEVPVAARPGFTGIRLLHFSDLHLYEGQEFLIDFLRNVERREHVDAVISTGDNFGSPTALPLTLRAHEIFADYPGAFVFGSNDYFSPRPKSWTRYLFSHTSTTSSRVPDLPWMELAAALRNMEWEDLSNRSASLELAGGTVALAGVDDPHISADCMPPVSAAWEAPDALRLGVTHAPYTRVLDEFALRGADVMLAGHTHGGQIGLPGVTSLVTNSDLPRSHGKGLHLWPAADRCGCSSTHTDSRSVEADGTLATIGAGLSWLHVSAGLGTSPYSPVRIATRPEVSVLHVYGV